MDGWCMFLLHSGFGCPLYEVSRRRWGATAGLGMECSLQVTLTYLGKKGFKVRKNSFIPRSDGCVLYVTYGYLYPQKRHPPALASDQKHSPRHPHNSTRSQQSEVGTDGLHFTESYSLNLAGVVT
jgi:hypothetical protein